MSTYFVTRHAGACEWARKQGFNAIVVSHFDPLDLKAGERVLGTLPVHLAAEVCERGRYFHLEMDVPAEMRGQELSCEQMEQLGAKLVEYIITKKPRKQIHEHDIEWGG